MLTIHKASAGSGKTYALTREYLLLLLGVKKGGRYTLRNISESGIRAPKAHSEILAITFTNKATDEMTERIIKELAKLADASTYGTDKESDYLGYLLQTLGTTAAPLQKHAEKALSELLFNFSWFNVSTIDSFFQRVLNTFARELDLPGNHAIELDEVQPIAIAVGKMLQSINERRNNESDAEKSQKRHLESWLSQFMQNSAEEGGSFNILSKSSPVYESLISNIKCFFDEKYKLNRKDIDEYLYDTNRISDFLKALSKSTNSAPGELTALCREAAQIKPSAQKKVVSSRLEAYSSGIFDNPPSPAITDALDTDDASALFKKGTPLTDTESATMINALNGAKEFITRKNFYKTLKKWVYYLGLFSLVLKHLEEYRKQNETLLLSDTNDLLHRIINEDETPFIYERMGTVLKHFLIDEFQDTSQMQWINLMPLVLESMSKEYDNLIIGDEKQCIYRFRNSDPSLLGSEVEKTIGSRFNGHVDIRGIKISENTNWRSSTHVVKFNNSLFFNIAHAFDNWRPGPVSKTYSGLIQQIPDKHSNLHGYVKAMFFNKKTGDGDDAQTDNQRLDTLVNEINRQLSAGYRPSDIAILVRTHSQGKQVITHLLKSMTGNDAWKHCAVPVMSADTMEINISPAVRMIVSMLRLTAQPLKVASGDGNDDNPEFCRCRLIHRFELSRTETVTETDDDGKPYQRKLTDSEALRIAVAATSKSPIGNASDATQAEIDKHLLDLSGIDSPTLQALTEHIITNLVPQKVRQSENMFITAFQDMVMDFSERGENNIHAFLNWWDDKGQYSNVSAPDGLDAINVLTIHKSKGLEYNCVHIPYCSTDVIKYHSVYMPNISWYSLDKKFFPDIENPECIPPMMPLPNVKSNEKMPALEKDMKQWETEQRIDALNVLYVAFTRAVMELCIYPDNIDEKTDKNGESNCSNKFNGLIHKAISSMTQSHIDSACTDISPDARQWLMPLNCGASPVPDANGVTTYEYGAPTRPEKKTGQNDGAENEGNKDMMADYSNMLSEYTVNSKSEICSQTDTDEISVLDINDIRHRGIFLHAVLGKVTSPQDMPRALRKLAYRYNLTEAEAKECEEDLHKVLSDKRVQRWFNGCGRVINERRMIDEKKTYRPDRVVWLPDGTVEIIDYKFGDEVLGSYFNQIKDYMGVISRAGYKHINGYLWFPLKGEIIEIK